MRRTDLGVMTRERVVTLGGMAGTPAVLAATTVELAAVRVELVATTVELVAVRAALVVRGEILAAAVGPVDPAGLAGTAEPGERVDLVAPAVQVEPNRVVAAGGLEESVDLVGVEVQAEVGVRMAATRAIPQLSWVRARSCRSVAVTPACRASTSTQPMKRSASIPATRPCRPDAMPSVNASPVLPVRTAAANRTAKKTVIAGALVRCV